MSIRYDGRLITSAEAARKLGVSVRRIQMMMESGELRVIESDGRSRLIDADSVKRAQISAGRAGRPFSAPMAMAALYMLSGERVNWIDTQQRYRLRRSLADLDALSLVSRTRRRAELREYWTDALYAQQLANSIRPSAGCVEFAESFQLLPPNIIEGYIERKRLNDLVREFRLQENTHPIVVRLHVAESLPFGGGVMPIGVCAADLAQSADPRERRAGLLQVEHLLGVFQRGDDGESDCISAGGYSSVEHGA